MFTSSAMKLRIEQVQQRIATAALKAGRDPASVQCLAVSKLHPSESVRAAHACGLIAFGENYVQEGVDKIEALSDLRSSLEWHCIGPVQSNKSKWVASHFDWIQSLDSAKLAGRLNEQRRVDQPPLNVCIQVNIDQGPTKSGLSPQDATQLAQGFAEWPRLRLRGLMCIPDPLPTREQQEQVFAKARQLFASWQDMGLPVDTLSMGMSDDLEAAVAQGSTLVRIGTAIFGSRPTR
jgi:pyridoxal phosphate enzyme (YggS family)